MSRGPGRVMQGVLRALEGGPLSTSTLALTAGASEASTRRALRTLVDGGRVCCLGYDLGGTKRWGLPEDGAVRLALLPPEREAHLAAVMGPRFARSVRRFLTACL